MSQILEGSALRVDEANRSAFRRTGNAKLVAVGDVVYAIDSQNNVIALNAIFTESRYSYANSTGTDARLLYPPGHIYGLVPSNGADTAHDISISVGNCADSTGAQNMILSSALVKQIDASWTVGTDQGGMDSGAVSEGSWYYIHLIKRSDTDVVDALFSLSSTNPSMPTNYDFKRLIGAVLTDSSANITQFVAYETGGGGLDVLWNDPPLDMASEAVTTGAKIHTVSVPTAFSTDVKFNAQTSTSMPVYFSCPDVNDEAPSLSAAPLAQLRSNVNYAHQTSFTVRTDASGTIRVRGGASGTVKLATLGWSWGRRP